MVSMATPWTLALEGGVVREAIEDAVGAIARFIFKVIIWDFVLFHLGRVVMLAATLGRYPSREDGARFRDQIQWVGIATLVVLWLVMVAFNNLRG